MRLHDLKPPAGATKKRKRVGRGTSSGHGKTSGRGQKGQLSRSGGGKGAGFEGGQMPLQRRVPKLPGFRNPFKKEFQIVNLERLSVFEEGASVGPEELAARGIIAKAARPVKVLGRGEPAKKLNVKAHAFSGTAIKGIEQAGGKCEVLQ